MTKVIYVFDYGPLSFAICEKWKAPQLQSLFHPKKVEKLLNTKVIRTESKNKQKGLRTRHTGNVESEFEFCLFMLLSPEMHS